SLTKEQAPDLTNKFAVLKQNLSDFNFISIDKLKILSTNSQDELCKLIFEGSLPYKIAMLDYLCFIEYLQKNYCKTKDQTYHKLSNILNEDYRSIKRNFLILNPISKENKIRYTSHLHKETVDRDYQYLK